MLTKKNSIKKIPTKLKILRGPVKLGKFQVHMLLRPWILQIHLRIFMIIFGASNIAVCYFNYFIKMTDSVVSYVQNCECKCHGIEWKLVNFERKFTLENESISIRPNEAKITLLIDGKYKARLASTFNRNAFHKISSQLKLEISREPLSSQEDVVISCMMKCKLIFGDGSTVSEACKSNLTKRTIMFDGKLNFNFPGEFENRFAATMEFSGSIFVQQSCQNVHTVLNSFGTKDSLTECRERIIDILLPILKENRMDHVTLTSTQTKKPVISVSMYLISELSSVLKKMLIHENSEAPQMIEKLQRSWEVPFRNEVIEMFHILLYENLDFQIDKLQSADFKFLMEFYSFLDMYQIEIWKSLILGLLRRQINASNAMEVLNWSIKFQLHSFCSLCKEILPF